MREIHDIRLITKIIVSSIIIFLISWLGFELAYNQMLYENYSQIYTDMITAQENFDKLWDIHINYIERVEAYDTKNTVD